MADSRAAGEEAATAAVTRGDASLLVVFAYDAYDLDALLAGIADVAPGIPMIGCTTAGEIGTDGPSDGGVVVSALGGPGFSVATAAAGDASARLREAGAEAAQSLAAVEPREHRVLLLLTDGLAGDQSEIVRGAHSVVGAAVPLVGGCAGDALKMDRTFQFHDGRVLRDSVVAAAISSDAPLGIGVHHGWSRVGTPFLVTRSKGTRVFELDEQPALDVYLDSLDAPGDARADPAAFTQFALTHPLGLARRSEEEQVRFIGEADFGDRSLGCIAEVPQGGLAWLMEGDRQSVLDATDAACREALEPLDGARPLGLLAFDCIARRGVLGPEGIATEIEHLVTTCEGAPVAGFYTYGEIARTRGVSGFHNQTLVVLAIA